MSRCRMGLIHIISQTACEHGLLTNTINQYYQIKVKNGALWDLKNILYTKRLF